MGRLTGIEHFMSAGAHLEEKEDATKVRRVKRERVEGFGDESAEADLVRQEQIAASLRMQKQFEGRIIRRTINCPDNLGKPLLVLPKLVRVDCVVKLTPQEMTLINELAELAKER